MANNRTFESWRTTHGHTASIFPGEWVGRNSKTWFWHRKSANGNVVADGSEAYARRIDCLEMAELINPRIEDGAEVLAAALRRLVDQMSELAAKEIDRQVAATKLASDAAPQMNA